VHHHLVIAVVAAVVILVVLTLNQLVKLSSVMESVTRHVTMQGFTSQICLLMSQLRNYRSYLEESARSNSIYITSFCAIVIVCFTRLLFSLMVYIL
jgi:hypothetical protein